MNRRKPSANAPAIGHDPRMAFFNEQAATWDAAHGSSDVAIAIARLEQLDDVLALKTGQDLLEVGCGTGNLTQWLAGRVVPGRVTAVDFSRRMLGKARVKNIDADFRCLDVCRDDLGEAVYDVVLCFHCFPHFAEQPAAVRNLARSLKADGRLIVIHLAGSEHINTFHASVGGAVGADHLPQGGQWNALLDQAGLRRDRLIDRDDLFFLDARRLKD